MDKSEQRGILERHDITGTILSPLHLTVNYAGVFSLWIYVMYLLSD